MAANVTGEAQTGPLRLRFDRSVKLAFCGSSISSDGGLLVHRELDDIAELLANLAGCRRLISPAEPGVVCNNEPSGTQDELGSTG